MRSQAISLFQTSNPQAALPQGHDEYFGISKGGYRVWGTPPVRQSRVGSQEIINQHVQFG